MESFLSAVETSPFPITTFIRSLTFSRYFRGEENLRKLGPLPRVTTLRTPPAQINNFPFLAEACANTVDLILHHSFEYPLRSAMEAVSAFPSLKSLGLHWISFSDVSLPATYRFPPQCRALSLLLTKRMSERFFQAILSLYTIPAFSSLAVREVSTSHAFFSRYLCHVGGDLQYLRFQFGSDLIFDHDLTWLHHSTGLRRLDLVSSNIPGHVVLLPSYITSSHLAAVNVIDIRADQIPRQKQWAEVDQALTNERFATLFSSPLESLNLHLTANRIETFSKHSSLDKIPVFSSLTLYGMTPTDSSFVGKYLCRFGNSLHRLRYELDTRVFSRHLRFTRLQSLELVYHGSLIVPVSVLRLLVCLDSSRLATVNIVDSDVASVGYIRPEWQVVDQALAAERFSSLKAFTVETESPEMLMYLPQSMLLAQARGILTVVPRKH
ncbi:hypothetical protein DFH09DRAFT_1327018 [Mycena vulgaris]|nr:hypothetical protein DFH09DRAFT_1327018 [Mycena vulgaris]